MACEREGQALLVPYLYTVISAKTGTCTPAYSRFTDFRLAGMTDYESSLMMIDIQTKNRGKTE